MVPNRTLALPSLLFCLFCCLVSVLSVSSVVKALPPEPLRAGFAEADITPAVGGDHTVYMAGFGQNRKATGVHDPLKARAVVLEHDNRRVALVSLDVIGFFHPNVLRVREQLPGFTYLLVTSTHNHEGPDTL